MTHRIPLRGVRMLVALIAMIGAFVAATTQARAADITAQATTNITVVNTSGQTNPDGDPIYSEWDKVRMEMTWSIPDSATSADWFTVPLDPNLNRASFIPFELHDGATGELVATASVIPDPANPGQWLVRFDLEPFVDGSRDVNGTAYFEFSVDRTKLNEKDPTVLDIYDTTIEFHRDPGPDGRTDYKYGNWTDNEGWLRELDANGALVHTNRAQVQWVVQLRTTPLDNAADPSGWVTATIVDEPRPGTEFRCGTDPATAVALKVDRMATQGAPVEAWTRYRVVSCAKDRLEVEVTKDRDDQGVFRVRFDAWFSTDAQGRPIYTDAQGGVHIGFNPQGYFNRATVAYDGVTRTLTTERKWTNQGGTGTGTTLKPAIDIEKHSGAWDGVVFTNGVAQLDADGQPVNQPDGDHDSAPGLTVPAGQTTPVTFTITNTGNETLDNVTVGDRTDTGAALTNITCTFNGSTTMPFNGLEPGQSFTCTATLPAITAAHADTATVNATGRYTGTTVGDHDAWHATPAPVAPTPQPQPQPQPQPLPQPEVSDQMRAPTQAALNLRKVVLTRAPRAGGRILWRMTVRNTSATPATRVRVCDRIPARLSLASPVARITIVTPGRPTVRRGVRMTITRGTACLTLPTPVRRGQQVHVVFTTNIATTARGLVRNAATAQGANAPIARASAAVRVGPPLVRGAGRTPAVTG